MKRLLLLLLSIALLSSGCGASPSGSASGVASSVPDISLPEETDDSIEDYTFDQDFTEGDQALTVRLHGTVDRTDGFERYGVSQIEILGENIILQTLRVKDAIDAACADGGEVNYGDQDRTDYFTADSGLALEDLNFDGFPDLRLICWMGNVNASYLCWLWDPETSQFFYAFQLSGYEVTTDPEARQIITESRDGPGMYYTDHYQYDSSTGKLLHTGQEVENLLLEDGSEQDDALVSVWQYLPNVDVDLKYASADNFTGQVIYDSEDPQLRFGTLQKLKAVQDQLGQAGFRLLIWDAYRPAEAQWKLWELCPDANFVSNPNKGFSNHSRGNTVDVTLVTLDSEPVEMPSGFDEFSALADRDYSDVSPTARSNAELLEQAMTAAGFRGYSKEWWHFSDTTDYPVIQ